MTKRAEYIPLTTLAFLAEGEAWTPTTEVWRLNLYEFNRSLYQNDHGEILDEVVDVIYPDPEENAEIKRVFINLYRSLSTMWGDLLFIEPPEIRTNEKDTTYLDDLIERTDFWATPSRNVCTDVSRYGTGLYKARKDLNGKAVIESVRPDIWFPVVSPDNINELMYQVIAYVVTEYDEDAYNPPSVTYDRKATKSYLKVEIHSIGQIEHRLYTFTENKIGQQVDLNTIPRYAALKEIEPTGVDDFCVIPVNNMTDSESLFGYDDYSDIHPLITQMEAHIVKWGRDLEDQGSLKYGPPYATSVTGNDERVPRNSYIKVVGDDNPPGAVTWDVASEAIKMYIDQLLFFFYIVSEASPALILPDFKTGNITGIALKRLIQRTLLKSARLAKSFDRAIKRILNVAAQLEGQSLTKFDIGWKDGLAQDLEEKAKGVVLATTGGVMSQRTGVGIVQDLEGKALDEEIAQIDKEKKAAMADERDFDNNTNKRDFDSNTNNNSSGNNSQSNNRDDSSDKR